MRSQGHSDDRRVLRTLLATLAAISQLQDPAVSTGREVRASGTLPGSQIMLCSQPLSVTCRLLSSESSPKPSALGAFVRSQGLLCPAYVCTPDHREEWGLCEPVLGTSSLGPGATPVWEGGRTGRIPWLPMVQLVQLPSGTQPSQASCEPGSQAPGGGDGLVERHCLTQGY